MLGKIIEIKDKEIIVSLDIDISSQTNLVNLHVVFEDGKIKIVGEIKEINKNTAKLSIVGELIDDYFLPGSSKKPSFRSTVRMIRMDELTKILGEQQIKDNKYVYFGLSDRKSVV